MGSPGGGAGERTRQVFPPQASSDSEPETERVGGDVTQPRTEELLDFLQPGKEMAAASGSAEGYYDTLQALKMKNRQYLLELGMLYQVKLEGDQKPFEEELEDFFHDNGRLTLQSKPYEASRSSIISQSSSLTDLNLDSPWDQQNPLSFPQPHLGPKSAASAWVSTITIPQPFKMTLREARKKPQLMKSRASLELEKQRDKRQSQEEAECQKQFRAQPVPAHVYLPLYQEIMEQNEIRREAATQRRKELLLSTQRPFSFLEKEDKKKEAIRHKVLAALAPVEISKPKGSKTVPKSIYTPVLGDKLKEAELYRKIRIQMRAKDLLENSLAPINPNRQREPQSRIATKTTQEKLSFLQDDFSFKPRINPAVPDFERLYWAFQREAIRIREVKEPTRNQPFKLRTSNLHCRERQANEQKMKQPSKAPVQRSRSLTGLSSLSSNTLPVHITDASRKRESAIRYSQEDKKSRENEGIHWMEIQRKKCQAMHKSMSSRAKAMDPHKSLEETHKEKLKQNWQNDRKRTKEYKKELEEIQIRVKNRPYLFEEVTKHDARQEAERHYRDTLCQVGLNEEFVRNKGRDATDLPKEEESETHRAQESQRDTDIGTIQEEVF
ncbi:family with sequence similarity 161 member B [Chelydra serpentina]|uniref:Family with sequence similarity 161 member B n=1 Tax=Chelydra serpentina TaxID=8475 RepID=A0A8T1T6S1_CHESE|nr:family with sequence similarity 161 member B [Chelydra serpentina]